MNEPEYPNRWRYVDGKPTCTAFKNRESTTQACRKKAEKYYCSRYRHARYVYQNTMVTNENNLKKIRTEMGLSLEQLAEMCSKGRVQYGSLGRGNTDPRLTTAYIVSKVLDVWNI